MVQYYLRWILRFGVAALVLIFAPVIPTLGTLDSSTPDGSNGSPTTSTASVYTAGATTSSSVATQQTSQSISPVIQSKNEESRQLIPAPAVSLIATSSRSNNLYPSVAAISPSINVKTNANATTDVAGKSDTVRGPVFSTDDRSRRLEEFKRSPYYLPPFREGLLSLPEAQLQYDRTQISKGIELFKQIAREGVERRGKFGSSVALMMKYGGKLISNFIRTRREEDSIPGAIEPGGDYFNLVADLMQQGIELSGRIKKERPYTRRNVDPKVFYRRVENLFDYLNRIVAHSPFGQYLRWSWMQIHKDDPKNPRFGVHLVEEGADLFAVSVYDITSIIT